MNDSARQRAARTGGQLARRPEVAARLAARARRRATRYRSRLSGAVDDVMTLSRLVAAWAGGRYRVVPVKTLVAVLGALVYFMLPLDTIPDFLFMFGFVDDALVIAGVMKRFSADLAAFRAWEARQNNSINLLGEAHEDGRTG